MLKYLTEEELSDRISLFFEVVDSISEEYYSDMLSESYDNISEDYQDIFNNILEFFVDEVDYNNPEMNEELSESIAELFLMETIGDVIAKFSTHARRERSADIAAKEYRRVAKTAKESARGSDKKGYKEWQKQKSSEANRLYGDSRERKSYHGKRRAELAAKIDRNVNKFAAHPVVHTGRAIVKGVVGATKLAAKGATASTKLLAKGIHKVLTAKLRKRHSLFQDRKYDRRLPRLRAIQKSSPNIKKTN